MHRDLCFPAAVKGPESKTQEVLKMFCNIPTNRQNFRAVEEHEFWKIWAHGNKLIFSCKPPLMYRHYYLPCFMNIWPLLSGFLMDLYLEDIRYIGGCSMQWKLFCHWDCLYGLFLCHMKFSAGWIHTAAHGQCAQGKHRLLPAFYFQGPWGDFVLWDACLTARCGWTQSVDVKHYETGQEMDTSRGTVWPEGSEGPECKSCSRLHPKTQGSLSLGNEAKICYLSSCSSMPQSGTSLLAFYCQLNLITP